MHPALLCLVGREAHKTIDAELAGRFRTGI